jgi:DNA-binding response OmpR family regulator
VAVVDDDEAVRAALRLIVDCAEDLRCVAEHRDGESALVHITSANTRIVLMDIAMPGISGIECTRRLKQAWPSLKIVMVTGMVDTESALASLCAGADGYLVKPFRVEELLRSIRLVLAGGHSFCAAILDRLFPGAAIGDPDYDGLINFKEYLAGYNPTNPDSDGDGLKDLQEYEVLFTSKLREVGLHLPRRAVRVPSLPGSCTAFWVICGRFEPPTSGSPCALSPLGWWRRG